MWGDLSGYVPPCGIKEKEGKAAREMETEGTSNMLSLTICLRILDEQKTDGII